MVPMKDASAPARLLFGVLLALMLSVRLLTPAGFMPAFDGGTVSIVACPDTAAAPAMPSHHHQRGDSKSLHQPCPYASAVSLGTVDSAPPAIALLTFFAVALLLGRTFLFLQHAAARERPPLRGPPIPA
jgi:hypothetical protein